MVLALPQVVYEIPSPGPTARLEMLKYHGRNKPVEDEGLYFKVAEVTAGWSAAALANLMNEAAILTVRDRVCCVCWWGLGVCGFGVSARRGAGWGHGAWLFEQVSAGQRQEYSARHPHAAALRSMPLNSALAATCSAGNTLCFGLSNAYQGLIVIGATTHIVYPFLKRLQLRRSVPMIRPCCAGAIRLHSPTKTP